MPDDSDHPPCRWQKVRIGFSGLRGLILAVTWTALCTSPRTYLLTFSCSFYTIGSHEGQGPYISS